MISKQNEWGASGESRRRNNEPRQKKLPLPDLLHFFRGIGLFPAQWQQSTCKSPKATSHSTPATLEWEYNYNEGAEVGLQEFITWCFFSILSVLHGTFHIFISNMAPAQPASCQILALGTKGVLLCSQRASAGQWPDLGREKRVHVSVLNVRCRHLINAWHHCALVGWYTERNCWWMASLLRDKNPFLSFGLERHRNLKFPWH